MIIGVIEIRQKYKIKRYLKLFFFEFVFIILISSPSKFVLPFQSKYFSVLRRCQIFHLFECFHKVFLI